MNKDSLEMTVLAAQRGELGDFLVHVVDGQALGGFQVALRPASRLAIFSSGNGSDQLSWPGMLSRCHWARMLWISPIRPRRIVSTALSYKML